MNFNPIIVEIKFCFFLVHISTFSDCMTQIYRVSIYCNMYLSQSCKYQPIIKIERALAHTNPPIQYVGSYTPLTMFQPIILKIISATEFQKLSPPYSDSPGHMQANLFEHAIPYELFSKISKRIAAISTIKKDLTGDVHNNPIVQITAPTKICASAHTSIRLSLDLPI